MNLHDNSPKFIPQLGSTLVSRIPRIPTALLKGKPPCLVAKECPDALDFLGSNLASALFKYPLDCGEAHQMSRTTLAKTLRRYLNQNIRTRSERAQNLHPVEHHTNRLILHPDGLIRYTRAVYSSHNL